MKQKLSKYINLKTQEVKELLVDVDASGHIPMYVYEDGTEWKAVPKWTLKVVNSSEFFASAHESRVRFSKPPLDGSDMPYGLS